MGFFKKSNPIGNVQIVPDNIMPSPPMQIQANKNDGIIFDLHELITQINIKQDKILSLLLSVDTPPMPPQNKETFDITPPEQSAEPAQAPPQKKWICKICQKSFLTKKKLGMHYVDEHSD